MMSAREAEKIAVRRILSEQKVDVYEVLDADDPRIKKLPIFWVHEVGGPQLPPKNCWYVFCNPEINPRHERTGGTVRVICVSRSSGEIIYETDYAEE